MTPLVSASVSVIVPVHNGAKFIGDCWQSIRAQTLPPAEVVFIDDGSTDETARILGDIQAGSIRVELLSQRCGGPAAARNAGVRVATGDFIAFLDVDDLWPERKLECALAAFRDQPAIDVVGGLVEIEWMNDEAPEDAALCGAHRGVNLGAFVFRATIFATHGELDPVLRYGEDVEYISRLRSAGVNFRELDEVTLRYRRHGGNMTRGRGAKELGVFAALARSLARPRPSRGPGRDELP